MGPLAAVVLAATLPQGGEAPRGAQSQVFVTLGDGQELALTDFRLQSKIHSKRPGYIVLGCQSSRTTQPLFLKQGSLWLTIPLERIVSANFEPCPEEQCGRTYSKEAFSFASDWFVGEVKLSTGEVLRGRMATHEDLIWKQAKELHFAGTSVKLGRKSDFQIDIKEVQRVARTAGTGDWTLTDRGGNVVMASALGLYGSSNDCDEIEMYSLAGEPFSLEIEEGSLKTTTKLGLDEVATLEVVRHYGGYVEGACKVKLRLRSGEEVDGTAAGLSRVFGRTSAGSVLFEVLDRVRIIRLR